MSSVLKQKITDYIVYLSQHPIENANDVANRFFSGNIKLPLNQNIVIPELLLLPQAKRNLVVNIIKVKTNCDVSASKDNFTAFVKIKEIGEVLRDGVPPLIKKIKWLFQ